MHFFWFDAYIAFVVAQYLSLVMFMFSSSYVLCYVYDFVLFVYKLFFLHEDLPISLGFSLFFNHSHNQSRINQTLKFILNKFNFYQCFFLEPQSNWQNFNHFIFFYNFLNYYSGYSKIAVHFPSLILITIQIWHYE